MYARRLVMMICIFGTADCSDTNSSIFTQLPEVMSYLCPNVDVCGIMYESPNTGACCTECSCESSCEVRGNCCFPSKLPYTSDNIGFNSSSLYKRECLHPTTLELDQYQKMLYQPYFMVTSVPNDLSCGDTKISFWGNLYPIYSTSRNQIYKNIACANADGVRDGIPWDAILECSCPTPCFDTILFGSFHPLEIVQLILEQGEIFKNLNCIVKFRIEGIRMESLKCYTGVIDDCPKSGLFQVPHGINHSAKEIIEACSARLVSPYFLNKVYANVFCFICNYETYNQDNVCYMPYSNLPLGEGREKPVITALLDTRFILEEGFKVKPSGTRKLPMACDITVSLF